MCRQSLDQIQTFHPMGGELRDDCLTFSVKSSLVLIDLTANVHLLSQRAVAAFAVAAADLQHHHNEHGDVQQEHHAEVTDAGDVEHHRILDPAAEERTHTQKETVSLNKSDVQHLSIIYNLFSFSTSAFHLQ